MKHCPVHLVDYGTMFSSCPRCAGRVPPPVQPVADDDPIYHPHFGTTRRADLRVTLQKKLLDYGAPYDSSTWDRIFRLQADLEALRTQTKPEFDPRGNR